MYFLLYSLNLCLNQTKTAGGGIGENSWISHSWMKAFEVIFANFEKPAVAVIKQTVCFVINFCKYSFCPLKNKLLLLMPMSAYCRQEEA